MPTSLREAHHKHQNTLDVLFRNVTRLSAFAVLALLVAIIVSLVVGSLPAIKAFGAATNVNIHLFTTGKVEEKRA